MCDSTQRCDDAEYDHSIICWSRLCKAFKFPIWRACGILQITMSKMQKTMKAYGLMGWPHTIIVQCQLAYVGRTRMIGEGRMMKGSADGCKLAQFKIHLPPVFNPLSYYWVDAGRNTKARQLRYSMRIIHKKGKLSASTVMIWIYSSARIGRDKWLPAPSLETIQSGCFYIFRHSCFGIQYMHPQIIGFEMLGV